MVAEIPCMYVPAFYDIEYNEDGTIKEMKPNNSHAKKTVRSQLFLILTVFLTLTSHWFHLLKLYRTGVFLKSREDVLESVVSVRQVQFISL